MRTKFISKEGQDIIKITIITVVALFIVGFISTGCTDKCEVDRQYTYYKPVFQTTEEIRSAVAVENPRTVDQPGKIYYKGSTLFINEVGSGVHVIDNANPRAPRQVAFVNIPGNFDIAAKGDFLYADSYIDLLVFDISDVSAIKLVHRTEGAFQNFGNLPFGFDSSSGVVTTLEAATVEEVTESDCSSASIYYTDGPPFAGASSELMRMDYVATPASAASPTQDSGVGGSMARFAIYQDYLYTIDVSSLYLFNISKLDEPVSGPAIEVGWGIETLFPYQDKLFIGANNGMHIFDNANPEAPELLSTYAHIQSCDPVVVEDNYAYVTLRSGTECQGFTNQLEVIDISDLRNPKLYQTYTMQNPHGLGVDGKCLFICEGEFGLKLFDKSDLTKIDENLVVHFENLHAFDVIPLNGILLMIGEGGFYQYEYDCEGKLELLSSIPVLSL